MGHRKLTWLEQLCTQRAHIGKKELIIRLILSLDVTHEHKKLQPKYLLSLLTKLSYHGHGSYDIRVTGDLKVCLCGFYLICRSTAQNYLMVPLTSDPSFWTIVSLDWITLLENFITTHNWNLSSHIHTFLWFNCLIWMENNFIPRKFSFNSRNWVIFI